MSEAKLEVGDYVKAYGSVAVSARAVGWGRVAAVAGRDGVDVRVLMLSEANGREAWWDARYLRWLDPATASALAAARSLAEKAVRDLAELGNGDGAVPAESRPDAPPRTEEGRAFQKAWVEQYVRSFDPVAKVEKEPEPLPMAPSPGPRCPRCAGPAYVGLLSFVCEREGGCRTPEERVQARAATGEPGRRVKMVRDRLKREDTFIFATAYLVAKRADVQMFPSYAQAEAAWRAWALAEERER